MDRQELERKLDAYRQARRRGVEYILKYVNSDGSVGPPEKGFFYYRTPWALATAGETEAATRLCDWVRRNQFAENGDFTGVSARPLVDWCLYMNGLMVVGAHILQQFDLSQSGIDYILAYQDPLSGGFYNYGGSSGHSDKEDIPYNCGVGLACLMTGRIEAAERVAIWLQRMWSLQPDLPDALYFIYSAKKQDLVTEFPQDQAKQYVLRAQEPRQRFTVGGIGAAFLARLYQARPRPEYLHLARKYQDFAMNQTDRQFEVTTVCKVGWGASLLYQITQEEIYGEWAVRVGDYFVETQSAEGHWVSTGSSELFPGWETDRLTQPAEEHPIEIENGPLPDLTEEIEVTSEFLVYLDVIISSLQAGR